MGWTMKIGFASREFVLVHKSLICRRNTIYPYCNRLHKAFHNTGPAYLNDKLNFYTPARQLRSASHALAALPRIQRTTDGGRSLLPHRQDLEHPPHPSTADRGPAHLQKVPQDLALRAVAAPPPPLQRLETLTGLQHRSHMCLKALRMRRIYRKR
ncbi:uncharacterized protein LOC144783216 [Lissotriton helveticus]